MQEEIEVEIAEVRQKIALAGALERLRANPDYQLLIQQEYLENQPQRIAMARGNPNLTEDQRSLVLRDLDGIGAFAAFLNTVIFEGFHAKEALTAYEEESVEEEEAHV